jgi:hypothetical protein
MGPAITDNWERQMIKQYRKRPEIIEAIQWDGDYTGGILREIKEFTGNSLLGRTFLSGLVIGNLEKPGIVLPGDWIIKDIRGEFYPCLSGIFELAFEEVLEVVDADKPDSPVATCGE